MRKIKEAVQGAARRPKVESRILSKGPSQDNNAEQTQSEPECDQHCLLGRLYAMTTQASGFSESWDYSRLLPPPASEIQRGKSRQLYQHLRPWQTRLIQLLPGERDTFPTCKLLTVEFVDMEGVGVSETSEVVTYAAISYVWGQTALDSQILCNGIWLPICRSLAKALFHLSRFGSTRYYWCDAICIDQENSAERALQVRNMLRIFEKADNVIAWMGQLESKHLPYLAFIKRALDQNDQIQTSIQGRRHNARCFEALRTLQKILSGFTKLPYFARTWIRQEIFAAKTVTLYFTDFKMAFDNLDETIQHWLQVNLGKPRSGLTPRERAPSVQSSLDMASQFSIMCKHFRHNGTDTPQWHPPRHLIRNSLYWLRTLQQGTEFEVTDPRDRIYALLGVLSSPTTRLYVAAPDFGISASNEKVADVFPVDYDKTVSQVYQDFMKYLINTNKNLDCLCVFQGRRRQAADLPSWVLDWRKETHRILVDFSPNPPDVREALGLATPQDLDAYGVLSISGFLIDKISSIYGDKDVSDLIGYPTGRRESLFDFWLFRGSSDAKDEVLRRLQSLASLKYVQVNQYLYNEIGLEGDYLKNREYCRFYVPRESMLDDHVVFAKGAEHPVVLRNVNDGQWQFIGPAFLVVHKQVMQWMSSSSREPIIPQLLGLRTGEHIPNWNSKFKDMRTYLLV